MTTISNNTNPAADSKPTNTPPQRSTRAVPILLTGYQYNDEGTYVGPYQFEKNMDSDEVYLRKGITLIAPPLDVPVDQEAYFDGAKWATRNLTLSYLPDRVIPSPEEIAAMEAYALEETRRKEEIEQSKLQEMQQAELQVKQGVIDGN
ncbi:hypothetical protein [Sapientia aquatica]|uniref:Uncharacterized protein n=1 Tax=Sapientia aquatica TaxID=1549640 RepID=A0A4R5W1G5_9BURK|nr:hypothetical protein [Sapientia aquatica]TDK65965.1 hypothetical protein E2I14_10245 [Sapientia aquatica]